MGALHDMDFAAFCELVSEIVALGFDEETAARYASLIGDLPTSDGAGNIIVRDEQGRELAQLPLKSFGGDPRH